MQLNNDSLFLGGRTLKEVHKYFRLPTDVHRVMDQDLTICEQWHEECGGCAFLGNSSSNFQIGVVVANMLM